MAAKPATNQEYLEFSEDGGHKGFCCGHVKGRDLMKKNSTELRTLGINQLLCYRAVRIDCN
jgi:hypothetical protein